MTGDTPGLDEAGHVEVSSERVAHWIGERATRGKAPAMRAAKSRSSSSPASSRCSSSIHSRTHETLALFPKIFASLNGKVGEV
jgi:hypothetical protein